MKHEGGSFGGCHAQTFEYLFKKYRAPMLVFARKLLLDHFMADELVADIFCVLWQKRGDFVNEKAVKAFLYLSVKNRCLNHLERRAYKGRVFTELFTVSDKHEDFVLNDIEHAEDLVDANKVLESLPAGCRNVIMLFMVQGHSTNKIAQRLNLAVSTVHNQRQRGIKLMQERFAGMQKK